MEPEEQLLQCLTGLTLKSPASLQVWSLSPDPSDPLPYLPTSYIYYTYAPYHHLFCSSIHLLQLPQRHCCQAALHFPIAPVYFALDRSAFLSLGAKSLARAHPLTGLRTCDTVRRT